MVPMRIFPQEVRRLEHTCNGRVVGHDRRYADVNQLRPGRRPVPLDGQDQGDERDDRRCRNVVVLGCDVAEELFPFDDPLGQIDCLESAAVRRSSA